MAERIGSHRTVQRYDPDRHSSNAEQVFTRLQQPAVVFFIPACQVFQREIQHERLALTGGKFSCFGISTQLPQGLDEPAARRGTVELHGLFSGETAGVSDLNFNGHESVLHGEAHTILCKFRITQPVTEREERLDTRRVIIAVSDENTFPVAGIVPLGKVTDRHNITRLRPGRGELAGRVCLAKQHVRESVACYTAQLAQKQNIIYLIQYRRNVHRTSHVQHQHEFHVLFGTGQNVAHLIRGQLIIAIASGPVCTFSGIAGKNINADIPFSLDRKLIMRFAGRPPHTDEEDGFSQFFGFFSNTFVKVRDHGFPSGFIAFHPGLGGYGKACVLQSLFHSDIMAYVHVTAAGAAFNGLSGTGAVERDFTRCGKWKISVLFQ